MSWQVLWHDNDGEVYDATLTFESSNSIASLVLIAPNRKKGFYGIIPFNTMQSIFIDVNHENAFSIVPRDGSLSDVLYFEARKKSEQREIVNKLGAELQKQWDHQQGDHLPLRVVPFHQRNSSTSMIGGAVGAVAAEILFISLIMDQLFSLDMTGNGGMTLPGSCGWNKGRWKFQGEISWSDHAKYDSMREAFMVYFVCCLTAGVVAIFASLMAVVPIRATIPRRVFSIGGLFASGALAIAGGVISFWGGNDNWCAKQGSIGISVILTFCCGGLFVIASGLVGWNKKWYWESEIKRMEKEQKEAYRRYSEFSTSPMDMSAETSQTTENRRSSLLSTASEMTKISEARPTRS